MHHKKKTINKRFNEILCLQMIKHNLNLVDYKHS